jgi:hypothetical protein
MAKWCSITSLGTPGISDGVQENMSEFARRKVTSVLFYLGESPAPMVTKFSQPPAWSGTFFLAERSWVNWGLLPEGTAASPMLMSSIGWIRSCLE